MIDILNNIVLPNLIMVGYFLIPTILARFADICLGLTISKKTSVKFDIKKFFWSIVLSLSFVVGLAALVTALSMIIPLVTEYGISVSESVSESLNGMNALAVCGLLVYVTVKTYGGDAFKKFKIIIGLDNSKNEDTEVDIDIDTDEAEPNENIDEIENENERIDENENVNEDNLNVTIAD